MCLKEMLSKHQLMKKIRLQNLFFLLSLITIFFTSAWKIKISFSRTLRLFLVAMKSNTCMCQITLLRNILEKYAKHF